MGPKRCLDFSQIDLQVREDPFSQASCGSNSSGSQIMCAQVPSDAQECEMLIAQWDAQRAASMAKKNAEDEGCSSSMAKRQRRHDGASGERREAVGASKGCKRLVRNCGLLYEGHTVCKGKKEVMHGQGVYMNSMHTGNMGDAVGTNDFLWQSYKGEFNNDKMSGQGSCGAFFLPPCQSGRLSVRVAAQCELLLLSSPRATRGKLRVVSFASDVPGCRVQGQSHLSMGLYSRAACATTVRSRAF